MIKKVYQSSTHFPVGTHIIADLYGCKNLLSNNVVRKILSESAKICCGTILHTKFHEFDPQGLTGYILLSESHISIHTWPEIQYAAVDVFTCGKTMHPKAATEHICRRLQATETIIHVLNRKGIR